MAEEVEVLAREIAGPGADAEIQELARRVAEAQIDLCRVRSMRRQCLSHNLRDPYYESRADTRMKVKVIGQLLRPKAPDVSLADVTKFLTPTPQGPRKFATILSEEAKQLLAMDRYERRALSRRKFAIRALDDARQKQTV